MVKKLFLMIVTVVVMVVMAEALLRVMGYHPWSAHSKDLDEPTMHEYDAETGWRNRAGSYSYIPTGKKVSVTFLQDGLRASEVNDKGIADQRRKIIVIGGSFTQGWALSDDETYPWQLQKIFPDYEVLNFGTGGFGTYQSLLMLERALKTTGSPALVVYGFIEHHEIRNVAPRYWLEMLSRFSKRGHALVPYATLDSSDNIERHPPESYLAHWFLHDKLALVALAEKAHMRFVSRKRESMRGKVTEDLMLEMNRVVKDAGGEFVVALLWFEDGSKKNNYINFLEKNNVMVIDVVKPMTSDMRIKGEGHPNGKLNRIWAEEISGFVWEQGIIAR
ncbi:MAG: hypothetical protein ISR96_11810 [Nitrospira sp.]|nr:hypothetical protein [bacterium]MBL7050189.1 hypothetical protein [Nitrospira sp.]